MTLRSGLGKGEGDDRAGLAVMLARNHAGAAWAGLRLGTDTDPNGLSLHVDPKSFVIDLKNRLIALAKAFSDALLLQSHNATGTDFSTYTVLFGDPALMSTGFTAGIWLAVLATVWDALTGDTAIEMDLYTPNVFPSIQRNTIGRRPYSTFAAADAAWTTDTFAEEASLSVADHVSSFSDISAFVNPLYDGSSDLDVFYLVARVGDAA